MALESSPYLQGSGMQKHFKVGCLWPSAATSTHPSAPNAGGEKKELIRWEESEKEKESEKESGKRSIMREKTRTGVRFLLPERSIYFVHRMSFP